VKARKIKGLDSQEPMRANAARIVQARLDELRSFEQRAVDPAAVAAQHDMRIAAKRLRYLLELIDSCFGAEATAARAVARDLQGVLGDIHDCDVMLPRTEGIESLQALLRARREQLFGRFQGLLEAEASEESWAALERALAGGSVQPRQAPP